MRARKGYLGKIMIKILLENKISVVVCAEKRKLEPIDIVKLHDQLQLGGFNLDLNCIDPDLSRTVVLTASGVPIS